MAIKSKVGRENPEQPTRSRNFIFVPIAESSFGSVKRTTHLRMDVHLKPGSSLSLFLRNSDMERVTEKKEETIDIRFPLQDLAEALNDDTKVVLVDNKGKEAQLFELKAIRPLALMTGVDPEKKK